MKSVLSGRLTIIGLGDLEGETMLGLYNVDGTQMPIMVDTYSLEDYEIWPQEDQNTIYQMMTSINPVIQTIVSDKNFVETEPGA